MVWRLLTRRTSRGEAPEDMDEARRRHLEEQTELRRAIARRGAVEHAAEQLRRANDERDFTALVEETFMRHSRPR